MFNLEQSPTPLIKPAKHKQTKKKNKVNYFHSWTTNQEIKATQLMSD